MSIDSAIADLDAKYPGGWELWRAATGGWCVRLRHGTTEEIVNRDKLSDAITAAVAYEFLPEFPRRPKREVREEYAIQKAASGSHRWLVYCGHWLVTRFPRKIDAEQFVRQQIDRSCAAVEQWDRNIAPLVSGKVEGKDFRFY
ncbi:MAG: hypothetical protein E6Q97_09750 [Desulfurellales bacterium]|nr:MAG: hypothetical protein E6Q97_09750 [Desulfurellales bacterium]